MAVIHGVFSPDFPTRKSVLSQQKIKQTEKNLRKELLMF